MGKCFSSWATWEKLCFVLGCAIVVTVFLGCAKLAYAHSKLRQYAAAAEEERIEQGVSRQMSQRRRAQETPAPEVPFGIRAIESGIEVDGVWISRNNTEEPSLSRVANKVSTWSHVMPDEQEIDLERQDLVHNHTSSVSNPSSGYTRTRSSFEQAISGERLSITRKSRDNSPDAQPIMPPVKAKLCPPSSFVKYSGIPAMRRQSSTANTIEGLDAIYIAAGPIHGERDRDRVDTFDSSHSGQSSSEGTDTEPIAAAAPRLLNHHTRPRQQSTDLDLMQSHRDSQAAETGQLTPRVRRSERGGDWTSIANHRNASETPSYFGQQRTRSPSPEEVVSPPSNTSPAKALVAPGLTILPDNVRRSSVPDVPSFAKFCQTAPPSRPGSAGSNKSPSTPVQDLGERISRPTASPVSPVATTKSTTAAAQAPRPPSRAQHVTFDAEQPQRKRSSFENRASSVVRGHGTGFEILKPGTFTTVVSPVEPGSHGPSPPVSLHNSCSRPRSSSADSRRKLRRKRQSSVGTGSETRSDG